tara:strand:- start:531 stop:680 length:150 start_codon:yes stop_codon:yes gene_type:complete
MISLAFHTKHVRYVCVMGTVCWAMLFRVAALLVIASWYVETAGLCSRRI